VIIPVLYNLLARFTRSSNAITRELERQEADMAGKIVDN